MRWSSALRTCAQAFSMSPKSAMNPRGGVGRAGDGDFDLERVAVHAAVRDGRRDSSRSGARRRSRSGRTVPWRLRGCRSACATAGSAASAGARGSSRTARRVFARAVCRAVHRLQEEMLEGRARSNAGGCGARLRVDELQFVAAVQHQRRARLGADADPVECRAAAPACRWSRPRREIPRACIASTSGASSCSSGSPPVQTTSVRRTYLRRNAGCQRADQVGGGRESGRRPRRRCRRTRCRRSVQTALARSSSRPLHRLQPAKRQNTAGVPRSRLRPAACRRFL